MAKLISRFRLFLVVCLVPVVAGLGACENGNPVKTAESPAQTAFALYGTFVVLQEAAVAIAKNPATPKSIVEALAAGDARAKPLVDAMLAAAGAFYVVKQELKQAEAAGASPAPALVEEVAARRDALEAAIAGARPAIAALGRTVGRGG